MITTLVAALFSAQPQVTQPQAPHPVELRRGLEPLQFLVGHCWRGQFPSGEVDMHCFDSVFDGQHVRDRHEVTGGNGVYRGETLYSWDGSINAVTFTYWNTLGGVSRGTMRAEGDRLQFGGDTYRGPDGREFHLATNWRRFGQDGYEAATVSSDLPSMNRTVRFQRVPAVTMTESRSLDGTLMLVHEAMVEAPVADVWNAISTPQGWRSWAVPVAWQQGPDMLETSYDPAAAAGDGSTIQHRILASIPGRMMVFRTVKAPDGFPHFDSFSRTTAAIELEAEGPARTRVRTVSAGFPDDEAGRQLVGFFREGNRISLDRLRRRFSEGPIDWTTERSREDHSAR
ncbi:MAG: SRPBCC family protein [Allosphingosinicella sp.]